MLALSKRGKHNVIIIWFYNYCGNINSFSEQKVFRLSRLILLD